MTKCFCDICGKEFKNYSEVERFKVKKIWYSWHESGWENLDVHKECWQELCQLIREKKLRACKDCLYSDRID